MISTETKHLFSLFNQMIEDDNSYIFFRKYNLDYFQFKNWCQENKDFLQKFKVEKLNRFLGFIQSDSPDFNGYLEKDFSTLSKTKEIQFAQLKSIAVKKKSISENNDAWLTLAICSTDNFFGVTPFIFSFTQIVLENGQYSINNKISIGNENNQSYLIEKKLLLEKYSKQQTPIGRDAELRKTLETLLCQENNNVMICGLPGVGKSSLIDKVSLQILNYTTSDSFGKIKLLQLEFVSLLSECSSKNDAEKKLIEIFNGLKSLDVVLIIEDIQYLCDKNQGLQGAFLILKEFLKCNNIRVLASCSLASLKKTFNADESFLKNFNIISLNEPDESELIRILKNACSNFNGSAQINPLAIKESIQLSKKYFRETALPLSAIQLLEKSIAGIELNNDQSHIDYLSSLIASYATELTAFDKNNSSEPDKIAQYQISLLNNLNEDVKRLTSYPLFENTITDSKLVNDYWADIKNNFNKFSETLKVKEILPLHITVTCASLTGIPAGKINQNEHEKLLNLAANIKQVVKGQDYAIELIVRKLKTWRMNLSTSRTVGSFFLLGPTGTGKTEMTKALAANLFDDTNAFIRFDMSEFKEEHSAALLIGAPPGYVGYEEGGLLVNRIRQKPHAVVLFDEIEKAHHTVFDLFLQIMDEGKLHDKLGFEGDFSNAIIIFTSNIASNLIQETTKRKSIREISQAELAEMINEYARSTNYVIKPEFLGRLSAIVPFAPINSVLMEIIELNINRFRKNLMAEHGVDLQINTTFVNYLIGNNLEFEKYGARKIKQTVQIELIEPIAEFLFNNKSNKYGVLIIDYSNNIKITAQ